MLQPSVATAASSRALGSYLPSVLVSGALAGYVARFGLPRSILTPLLGSTWDSLSRAARDLALGASLALLVLVLDAVFVRALLPPESVAGHYLLPKTLTERAAWFPFAVAAGVGEELVYRGYLQAQLSVLAGSRALGVVLQALLFGIAHGEHGGAVVARFALYGLLFGALALRRRSLIPGALAHVALDVYAGLAT
ncbi:MAG: CPBP family intramembrane metalloprotease [Myxococcales bacterium]|nr:MAG: CPBP family intramembrane metalloprotease [Myxococcales bacterium]